MLKIIRFLFASLASALSALLLVTLTMPFYLFANTGSVSGEGFWATAGGVVMMAPAILLFGGIIALPLAMLAGGAMLGWQAWRGTHLCAHHWLIAGAVSGAVVALFVGSNDPIAARLITALWFATCGAGGAWVFAQIMSQNGCRRMPRRVP